MSGGNVTKMKAVIHIGLPKCGTQSIKFWLRLNRDALEAKGVRMINGDTKQLMYASVYLAFRDLGADEKTAMHGLDVRGGPKKGIHEIYEDLSGWLEQMMAESGVFVHSRGNIFERDEIQIIALDRYLSKFFEERIYVAYIKDTIDLFTSIYSQCLRSFRLGEYTTIEFQEWLKKCVHDPRPNRVENYLDHLLVWEKVVGQRLNVRLLESDWLVKGNLIEDFASLVGTSPFDMPPRQNESFAAEYIEYIRFLNQYLMDDLPMKTRGRILNLLTDLSAGKPKLSVSDEHAEWIRESFREREENIRKRFFPNRPYLFSPKSRGKGNMPIPLTNRCKAALKSKFHEKMALKDWESSFHDVLPVSSAMDEIRE